MWLGFKKSIQNLIRAVFTKGHSNISNNIWFCAIINFFIYNLWF